MLICDELVCTIVFLLNLSKNTRCFLAWVCIARADYWFWYYQSIFYSAAWIQQLWFHLYCNWLKSIQGKVLTLVSWTYYLASWSLQTSFTCKNEKKKKIQQCICLNTVASHSRYYNNFTYLDFAVAFSRTSVKFPCIINKLKFRIISYTIFFRLHFKFSRQQSLTD